MNEIVEFYELYKIHCLPVFLRGNGRREKDGRTKKNDGKERFINAAAYKNRNGFKEPKNESSCYISRKITSFRFLVMYICFVDVTKQNENGKITEWKNILSFFFINEFLYNLFR